jgi:hypothetical protein
MELELQPLPVPIEPGKELKELPQGKPPKVLSIRVHADHDINTKNPIGNEPLLSPKYNLTRSTYELPYPEGQTPPKCYEYESRIYADYTASANAKLSIWIEAEGRNGWWVHGWSGNWYSDRIELTLIGEQHGWYFTSGKLVAGEGRYD